MRKLKAGDRVVVVETQTVGEIVAVDSMLALVKTSSGQHTYLATEVRLSDLTEVCPIGGPYA